MEDALAKPYAFKVALRDIKGSSRLKSMTMETLASAGQTLDASPHVALY
jgi:hypothetical protein